ncbi:hypothetical protein [Streptomyces swartbergensis]|uniref:hypothetical protein n=1 Tax=Streptomyces swartbergensis TaxID=487165 RepID=UPI0013029FA8|nr:hypothetical protein [Streptomyces swartbergensis]
MARLTIDSSRMLTVLLQIGWFSVLEPVLQAVAGDGVVPGEKASSGSADESAVPAVGLLHFGQGVEVILRVTEEPAMVLQGVTCGLRMIVCLPTPMVNGGRIHVPTVPTSKTRQVCGRLGTAGRRPVIGGLSMTGR